MAKAATQLISTRIAETLKEEFLRSAEFNEQSPSEALRRLIVKYVRETERELLRREAASIRASKEDEDDVLNWLASMSVLNDED